MSTIFEKAAGGAKKVVAVAGQVIGAGVGSLAGGGIGARVGSTLLGSVLNADAQKEAIKKQQAAQAAYNKQQAAIAKSQALNVAEVSGVPVYVWVLGIVGLGAVLVMTRRRK